MSCNGLQPPPPRPSALLLIPSQWRTGPRRHLPRHVRPRRPALQDFPYYFEAGVQHWLLWCTEALPPARVQQEVEARFPAAEWDSTWFINPEVLQSVRLVGGRGRARPGGAGRQGAQGRGGGVVRKLLPAVCLTKVH